MVAGRILGSRKPLFADWSVALPPRDEGDGGLTLRELISLIVQDEVAAFRKRAEARKLDRVMNLGEIDQAAARGKVDPAGKDLKQEIDEDDAVDEALQAFEDGLYLVVIDEVEKRDLDEQVFVTDESRVVFLRLTFLAGA